MLKRLWNAALLGANTVKEGVGPWRASVRLAAVTAWTKMLKSGVDAAISAMVAALAAKKSGG
jgi:hypothetical protein